MIYNFKAFTKSSDYLVNGKKGLIFICKTSSRFGFRISVKVLGPLLDFADVEKSDLDELSRIIEPYEYAYLYSNINYSEEWEFNLRKLGFSSRIGQSKSFLTYIINPQEYSLSRSAKRNIRLLLAKERMEIKESVSYQSYKQSQLMKRLKPYDEEMFNNILSEDGVRVFSLFVSGRLVCSRVIYIKENKASDIFAWQTEKVRGATYYLVDEIFKILASNGVLFFDFSGIPIGRDGAEGVADFKMSFKGGQLNRIVGEWSRIKTKTKWKQISLQFYEYFSKKY